MTLSDVQRWIAETPKPLRPAGAASRATATDDDTTEHADLELVKRTHEYLATYRAQTGIVLTFSEAANAVAIANPALTTRWFLQNGENN